jgi:hypothetical protein
MKNKIVYFLMALIIVSCKSYDFSGKRYKASNQEKKIQIEFVNDTLCKIKQEFLCDELSETYRNTTFNATYKIDKVNIETYDKNLKPVRFKSDILVINNLDCPKCEKYKVIPNYVELNCTTTKLTDERLKDKVKLGVIYNMVNDTLVIDKKQIWFGNLKLKKE